MKRRSKFPDERSEEGSGTTDAKRVWVQAAAVGQQGGVSDRHCFPDSCPPLLVHAPDLDVAEGVSGCH